MKPISLLTSLLTALSLVLIACQPMPLSTQVQSVSGSLSNPAQSNLLADQQAFIQAVKNKKPYTGPIQIRMNPSLIKPSQAEMKDLSDLLSQSGFKTQSIPEGNIVYQDTFTTAHSDLVSTHNIEIQDTTQRYTLHVQKMGEPQEAEIKVSININGSDYAQDFDLKENVKLIQSALILNVHNTLRLRLQAPPNTSVQVSLIEGGQAGTILRRRGELRNTGATQATHLQQNDTNIFNPFLSNSLGDLTPYQGDVQAEMGGRMVSISKSQVNQDVDMLFETGVFEVEFTSEAAFEAFKNHYSAEVLDFNQIHENKVYLLKIDLNNSPVENIIPLLRAYNQGLPSDITSVDFSSLPAMQTFTLVLDAIVNHPEWLKTISLNIMGQGGSEAPVMNDWVYHPFWDSIFDNYPPYVFPAAQQGFRDNFLNIFTIPYIDTNGNDIGNANWSMAHTFVPNAWNYSVGTGVKVAWLDQNARLNHSKLKRRYISTADNPTEEACSLCGIFGGIGQREHGHNTMMVGFAEKDNGIYTAGVAPNAQVMPFHTVLHWDMVKALQTIRQKNLDIDIIGSAVGWPIAHYLGSVAIESGGAGSNIFSLIGSFFKSPGLEYELADLYPRDIPFIQSAGNHGSKSDNMPDWLKAEYIPSLKLPGVLVINSADLVIKDASGNPLFANARDSNYYESGISFWAPGENIFISPFFGGNVPEWFSGTSAASPFMAGVVALMKSRNPDLTIEQIKVLLTITGTPLDFKQPVFKDNVQTNELPTFQLENTRFVNALAAVKAAIQLKQPQPESYLANEYFGLVQANGSLQLNQSIVSSALPEEKHKQIPEQTVSDEAWARWQPGQVVKVRAWSNMPAGSKQFSATQLEVLEFANLCNSNNCAATSAPWFSPLISNITQVGGAASSAGFDLVFSGKDLVAQLQSGMEAERFQIYVYEHGSTNLVASVPISVSQNRIKDIANDGSQVTIHFDQNQLTPGQAYDFRLVGAGPGSNLFQGSGTTSSGFQIQAEAPDCQPTDEQWSLRVYNVDDTATAYVNLNNILTVNYHGDSGWVPINQYLQTGSNQLRFTLFNQAGGYSWGFQVRRNDQIVFHNEAGQAGVVGANNNDQSKPNQIVFDETVPIQMGTSNGCAMGNGLMGSVFNNTTLSPPVVITKVFPQLNFVDGNKNGDQFSIGLINYFSIRFEGFLRLPPDYPTGTYTLILGHDDGARLFVDNQSLINAWGAYDYTEHQAQVQLIQGQSYPLTIEYHENGGEAELGFFWIKPDGGREFVPASALGH